jgi:hypothetical protein
LSSRLFSRLSALATSSFFLRSFSVTHCRGWGFPNKAGRTRQIYIKNYN